MNIEKLDAKDREILYELDKNCRQSNQEIGKKVRLSKQVVDYRIKRLLKVGYITRFASVIDTYKLGLMKFKIYLSLENADKEKIKEITEFLVKHKKTEWVATCSGKWDIIAGFIVKDVYEFNDALKDLEDNFSGHISSRETTTALGVPHWRKDFLTEKKVNYPVVYQGGSVGDFKIDDIDREIINIIVNNARMPITDISRRLDLTSRIVTYRLSNLRKNKIILMHRFFLNLEKINWIFCKALIKFHNLTRERYDEFFSYCSGQKNLTYLVNCVGSWDVELDFEISDFNTFHKIMLNMRDKFTDIIKSYDFVIAISEDKHDYFPGCYPVLKMSNGTHEISF